MKQEAATETTSATAQDRTFPEESASQRDMVRTALRLKLTTGAGNGSSARKLAGDKRIIVNKIKDCLLAAMSNDPIAQELVFTPELQHAIEDLMRAKAVREYGARPAVSENAETPNKSDPFAAPEFELDELDRPDFDPIDYVNRMFTTGFFFFFFVFVLL